MGQSGKENKLWNSQNLWHVLLIRHWTIKKAEDIQVIDISQVSVLADYFIIANGNSESQVRALVDNVEEELSKAGYEMKQREGYGSGNWVLMDFGEIIVHVFDKENRLFYDLERIWRDGKHVDFSEL